MLKNNKGFTLLEVLLVVSLLGIILAITIPNIGAGSRKANDELCSSTKLIIQAAAEQYEALERNSTDLSKEVDFIDYLVKKEYLRYKLECPNGGTYKFDGVKKEVTCDRCKIVKEKEKDPDNDEDL